MKRPPRSEASRARASSRAHAYWADPDLRAAHGENTRTRMDNPAVRTKVSERTREALADPEVRSRHRQRTSGDPEWRKRVSEGTKAAMANPAVRQLISDQTKAGIAARAAREQAELDALDALWRTCSNKVRRRFFEKITAPGPRSTV